MSSPYQYRHGRRTVLYAPEYLAAASECSCHKAPNRSATSSLEQKIKENPMIFMIGALLAGWFLAKKR